ncbi:MAG: bifunctional isocitrate dehydrogenase kinase/phosphatase [Spirochaetes bacterium]|nr:MAG: bifunctional isocitrate dehydrogenase kinase/phosphatase [Spirochaetota bacterium]
MIAIGQLAGLGAERIHEGFLAFQNEFRAITARAAERFARRDWHGVQRDSVERLDLYRKIVDGVVADTREALGGTAMTAAVWAQMKAAYSRLIAGAGDFELAETFFNSITRRIFATVGVDRAREFIDSDFNLPPARSSVPFYHVLAGVDSTAGLVRAVLGLYDLGAPYQNIDDDVMFAARSIDAQLGAAGLGGIESVETLKSVFYRNKGAYIVGRAWSGEQVIPLVFALRHPREGVTIDAALTQADDASIVFSFTRSYFSVTVENPHEVIEFLRSIMPQKRVAELYISIGYNKHGKTELYRELLRYLESTSELFEIAPGERGMVMMVFALPSFDVVFKIIRDRFAYPKTATRREVMDKYALVFKHDRAGRMVDAQEFEHLLFDRARFREDLLQELLDSCTGSVTVEGDRIAIRHLYTERRMTPLNLYLRDANPAAARAAIIDYGQAVKDLAASNIFPGDMLLKNFGVTRHGRVVFYDYDELGLLTEYSFRAIPRSDRYEDEMSAEPWFHVGENDIFPEEFIRFFGLRPDLKEVFLQAHEDLLSAEFWKSTQQRIRAGEILDVFPYPYSRRLHRD